MKDPKSETRNLKVSQLEKHVRRTRSVLECASPLALSGRVGGSSATQSARGLAPVCVRRTGRHSKTWRLWLAMVISAFSFQLSAFSQSYSIDWHTIDGGGGTSTGGVYSISGTIGQPDAGGPMTNGQYSVTGGFWAWPQAVQTEGAPTLSISPASPGFALISWTPATGTNWVLQERLSLTTGSWINASSGTNNPVTVSATLPTKFYRLFKP